MNVLLGDKIRAAPIATGWSDSATYVVFDLLYEDYRSLFDQPLVQRRQQLGDEPMTEGGVRHHAARRVYRWWRPPRYGIARTSPWDGGSTARGIGELRSSER